MKHSGLLRPSLCLSTQETSRGGSKININKYGESAYDKQTHSKQYVTGVRGKTSLPNGVISEDFRKVQQLSQALREGWDLTSKDKQERSQGRCRRITKAEAGVEGLSELLSG